MTDALIHEALVKLKLGFTCRMTDIKNSTENNLIINIRAKKRSVSDRWIERLIA